MITGESVCARVQVGICMYLTGLCEKAKSVSASVSVVKAVES